MIVIECLSHTNEATLNIGSVAQVVEQGTHKPLVSGSTPLVATIPEAIVR
jgi:hypothetical protein